MQVFIYAKKSERFYVMEALFGKDLDKLGKGFKPLGKISCRIIIRGIYLRPPNIFSMKRNLSFILFFLPLISLAQLSPIDITDQTIKIAGLSEENMYFGFAEGDKIIFSFQEINNKELKKVEILEYPFTSKFTEFKTTRIENKTLSVQKKGIYKFRFYNGAVGGRICKIKIQRIPSNETTKNFISNVRWINKQDTTWNVYTKDIIVGYDTTYVQKKKKDLVKTEQKEELILDKIQRVHSETNENGNKSSIFFTLPKNITSPYKTQKVISWAYWIGVDEEGAAAWKSNVQTIGTLAKGVASIYLTPLGALAVGAVSELMVPKLGEDVYYCIVDQVNRDLFYGGQEYRLYDKGKGVAGYQKFTGTNMLQGTWHLCMKNDNYMQGVNAEIKVVAIIETNIYEDKDYTEAVVTPKYEKKIFRDPVITNKNIPIIEM